MKHIITIITITILGLTTAFSENEKSIVINFETENKSDSPYYIHFTSKENPNDVAICEIPAFSKTSIEIEQSKEEWQDTIALLKDIPHASREQDESYSLTTFTKANELSSINNEKEFEWDLDLRIHILFDSMGTYSDVKHEKDHEDDTFFINNVVRNIEFSVLTNHKKSDEDDEKIHKKFTIIISHTKNSFTGALNKSKTKEHSSPFFYEIFGNGFDSNNPLYLLGTCHTLSPYDYDEEILSKIENTETLISEFQQNSEDTPSAQYTLDTFNFVYTKFLEQDLSWFRDQFTALEFSPDEILTAIHSIQDERKKLKNPNFSETWFTQLTETEQEFLNEISIKQNIDLSSIHPAFLGWLIDLLGETALEKEHIEDSLEIHLIKLFTEKDKEIVYLDTQETMLWAFVHEDFLPDFQKDISTCIEEIKKSIATWQQSSSDRKKNCWTSQEYFDAFDLNRHSSKDLGASMDARNFSWQKKILESLKAGKSASIIMGAGHLAGKTGFLKFLQEEGYYVKHASVNEETQNKINEALETFDDGINDVFFPWKKLQKNEITDKKNQKVDSEPLKIDL